MKKTLLFTLLFSTSVSASSGGAEGAIPGYVVSQVVNLILLFGIIYFWQGKTITAFFRDKKESFLKSLALASKAKEEAEEKKKEIEIRLSELKTNFQSDIEEAKKNAEESYRVQVSDARNEALRIGKETDTALNGEMQKAVEGLRVETFEKSVDMASKNLEKNLTPVQQQAWNQTFSHRVKGAH